MKYLTTTETIAFSSTPETRALTVDVGAGSLLIETQTSVGVWTATDTITTSGGFPIYTAGLTLRFTPSGGASYAIDTRTGL